MQRNLSALADGVFDLLIIGGGIFGGGIARDAALRGLRVALVEQHDFASGTSSRSSKLIHGGFRYLEQRAFALVAESTRERRILQDIAPHRVRPLPFLLPVYRGDPRPLWLMRLGMTLYDVLALYRNPAAHRKFSPARTLATEPGLDPNNLRGAIHFYDCQEDDARFCIDNLLHAAALGAVCANYCEVTGFSALDGKINSATVTDHLGAGTFDIRARAFINAAGPWVERVAGLLPPTQPGDLPRLSPTKGVHILLPRITQSHGIFFQGRHDGRMLFILPWNDCTMVGTTDTDFKGDPADVRADVSDVEYLLAEVRSLFPNCGLTASDVITTFAGIRPLLRSDTSTPSARSREHSILRRGENLLSIAGGKYTTYRLIAEQVVDAAYGILGCRPAACRTAKTPLPDFRPATAGERIAENPEIFASDVTQAVSEEMASSVEDVMRRRTGLALSRSGGPAVAERVARIMTTAAPQDAGRIGASLRAYCEEWDRNRPGN
jgi:glycerol-3-phosphate dehydrogenase